MKVLYDKMNSDSFIGLGPEEMALHPKNKLKQFSRLPFSRFN